MGGQRSVHADDDLGMAQPDHVAIGELPLLHRRVVDRRAVRRIEVGEQCHLTVPADFQVTTRNTGVGQAELSVLPTADHVRTLTQLVGAAAAVVELQCDGGAGRRVVALAVAVTTGRGLAVVVSAALGFAVSRLGVSGTGLAVAPVVGLGAVALVLTAVGLSAVAALIRISALFGVAAALIGIAALVGIGRPAVAAFVGPRGGTSVVVVTRGGWP